MDTTRFIFLGITLYLVAQSDASSCFECKNIPLPRDCTKLTECNANEYCSVEQIVTPTGYIVYNSGCLPKSNCPASGGILVGKRSTNITERRNTPITVCIECCIGDFCNNQGCGSQNVPLGQRGPYCFNCDSVLNASGCRNIAACDVSEQCMLYSPAEFGGFPETMYRSQCENKAACAVLSLADKNYTCAPTCCDSDFCNNQCGLSSNSLSTSPPHTTLHISTQPAQTKAPAVIATEVSPQGMSVNLLNNFQGSCKPDHYFDDLSGICIYIDETQTLDYAYAKRACESLGDELVTIDTHAKTVFIENMILHHTGFSTESERNYYIGLTDKYDNSMFYWQDGQKVFYTNWGGGDEVVHNQQPDDSDSNPQNCVILYGADHYRWHDDKCQNKWHYICEDRSVHNHQIDPNTTNPPPTHHSSTFHCDAHNGYMLLKSAHENLCVHIVTQHANWDDARARCQSEGGDLVVLDNSEKAHLVRNKVNEHTYSGQIGYWIGAKDFSKQNHFSWINHQPVTYGDWHKGQPNHHDGGHDQDCACMYSSGEHFQWHDDYCPKHLGYICERR